MPLKGYYSFVEDFRRDGASVGETRKARFGNGWVKTTAHDWVPLNRARFTASGADWEARDNIDGGASGSWFFLATGGDIQASHPLQSLLRLPRTSSARRQRLAAWLSQPPSAAAAHRCFRGLFAPWEIEALLSHWELAPGSSGPPALAEPPSELASQESVAWLEGSTYLRNQLLPDSDAYSMAVGMELRLPLVDAQLQQALEPVPAVLRYAPGKALLALL